MINYNFKNNFKTIRTSLGLSQIDFADKVGLSRSNIARYEAGQIQPRINAIEKIYNFAFENGFDLNSSKTMIYEDCRKDQTVLYHGARKEIIGNVDAKHSIPPNDLGNGFYLGQSLRQANMWVCGEKNSSTYCFYFNKEDLSGMKLEVGYDWMMVILYYRGQLDEYIIPDSLKKLINKIENMDYAVLPIADNQMYDTLEMFKNNLISDVACQYALRANELGYQYVLKSEKACKALKPIDRLYLCQKERDYYLKLKKKAADDAKNKVIIAISQYRKEGKLFNEIFKKKR